MRKPRAASGAGAQVTATGAVLARFSVAAKKRFWKGCKPNSVCPALGETGDARQFHQRLGRESFVLAADTRNPFRRAKNGAGSSEVPYLALHPMGFSVPPGLRRERWSLTPPFHPYPVHASMSQAVYSLWHCPSGCLAASLPEYIPKLSLRVTRHRALRCSDFPPPSSYLEESDSPPFQKSIYYNRWSSREQLTTRFVHLPEESRPSIPRK
jgi:hypothetical protein